jgi:hypothetical protein
LPKQIFFCYYKGVSWYPDTDIENDAGTDGETSDLPRERLGGDDDRGGNEKRKKVRQVKRLFDKTQGKESPGKQAFEKIRGKFGKGKSATKSC